jgi:two-component sensor histidine kinase
VIVNDTHENEHYYADTAVEIELDVRAILCVPLKIKQDIIGVLQVIDTTVDRFQPSELRLVESLAATAAIAIDNARLYKQARQDAIAKTALLDEANHRVKNNLSAIMGILALELQKPYDKEDDFRALLRNLLARIQGMSTVHSLLSEAKWAPLSLKRLTEEIIHAALSGSPISHKIKVHIKAPQEPLAVAPRQATNLAVLINELTTNSIKHAFQGRKQGTITVDIQVEDEEERRIVFRYRDDGPGWPEGRLAEASSGVGLRLMHLIAQGPMLDEFDIKNDNGALATLRFRLVPFS